MLNNHGKNAKNSDIRAGFAVKTAGYIANYKPQNTSIDTIYGILLDTSKIKNLHKRPYRLSESFVRSVFMSGLTRSEALG